MPTDASPLKIKATAGYGGNVKLYDREKEKIKVKFAQELKSTVIEPFNNPNIIAGAGTAAKELFEEVGELDHLFVPIGGGGLISGSCISAEALSPNCEIHGVEPLASNDAQKSLEAGEIQEVKIMKNASIADGALTTKIGDLNWHFISKHVQDILTC